MRMMKDKLDKLIDVHAIAYNNNGEYELKLVDVRPAKSDGYVKVIESISEGRQLILWVPEGTPGQTAQNLATHFVPQLRNISHPV
jgi:hypothetical protein